MVVKAPYKKITTEEHGVMGIFGDGKLVGIIHNDISSHVKRVYEVSEMGIDDIASLMERDETEQRVLEVKPAK